MKIVQLISSTRTSGAEKHFVILSEFLSRRGHDVLAVCPPGGWLPEQLRAHGVPALEISMHGVCGATAAIQVRRLLRETHADLIHTHLTRAAYVGYVAARTARVPVASSMHVLTRDLAYRWLPRGNQWFITVSDFLRQALIARGVHPSRAHTVYNGTDFDLAGSPAPEHAACVRAELGLPSSADVVVQVGRVDEFKGAHLLVHAAKSVVDRHPNAHFVFAGHADPRFQRALGQAAGADGIGDRLRFAGVRDDVPRIMAAGDVVTVPSLFEQCPMVIAEAMAMGKPVVATRVGGVPEMVGHGETGLLIERTAQSLADAVATLLSDPDRALAMGALGRVRARDRFSAPVMAQSMERAYARIMSRSDGP